MIAPAIRARELSLTIHSVFFTQESDENSYKYKEERLSPFISGVVKKYDRPLNLKNVESTQLNRGTSTFSFSHIPFADRTKGMTTHWIDSIQVLS